MAITNGDVKLFESQRLSDEEDGGGFDVLEVNASSGIAATLTHNYQFISTSYKSLQ